MDRALFQQSTTLRQLHHVVGRGLDDLPHVVVKGFINRAGQVIEPVLLSGMCSRAPSGWYWRPLTIRVSASL